MRRSTVLIFVSGLVVVAGCADKEDSSSGTGVAARRVTIVTTTTQLADFARVVGGSHITVYGVLKANVDPHDYEPSPADVKQIGSAKLLVKNGLGLEKWFDDTIKGADHKGQTVDASEGVKIRKRNGTKEVAEGDPHIWHNPANAKIMVHNVEQALEKVDSAHQADYRKNEADYVKELDAVDAKARADLGKLTNKKLVTNHDAFGYYIDRYRLQFVGSVIPSFDTQAELSAKDIEDLVAKIKATGVKAVFSESSLPPKTAESIGKEAGVKVVAGDDALYGDTLGPAGSDGDTYLKMIRHNTKEIVDNLS